MKLFSVEEFAALRRKDQNRYAAQLQPAVTKGIATGDFDHTMAVAARIFEEAYRGDTNKPLEKGALNAFADAIVKALTHADTNSDALATSLMIATAALNSSAIAAAHADDEDLVVEWVDMEDTKVRPTHKAAHGQQRAPGELFSVGESEMPYPGWTGAPIEEWINCRCVVRPARSVESRASAALLASLQAMESQGSIEISEELFLDAVERGIAYKVGERDDGATLYDLVPEDDAVSALRASLTDPEVIDLRASLVADASTDDGPHTSLVVVALPAADDPVHGVGDEQKHLTLAFLGDYAGDNTGVHDAVSSLAGLMEPFSAQVSGNGTLGPQGAKVLFVEAQEIQTLRDSLTADPTVAAGLNAGDAHPHFVPHMTVDYAADAAMPDVQKINFDRLGIWQGEDQTEYPLGVAQAAPEQPAAVAAAVEPAPVPDDVADAPEKDAPPVRALPPIEQWGHDDTQGIPVHGVLAPEGVESGDRRGFKQGALSNRPLPLPITWQEKTAEGHDDAAVVVVMTNVEVIDGLQHFAGHMRQTEDADKALGLMIDFGGRYGLSVDADAVNGQYDEEADVDWFSEARACGASMVNIPAFPEAFIALGLSPVISHTPGEPAPTAVPEEAPDDTPALVAGGAFLEKAVQLFKDLAPGVTEDGPGWLTHPVDTDRLRDYWVRGEGAAKIGWGVPGDFNRCRVNLAQYVKPEFLNGYCANRHYDALHVWPGQEAAAQAITASGEMAPAFTLVASAGGWCAPSDWFTEPDIDGPAFAITEEGRTFGYIAEWGACHIGLPGVCTAPPKSLHKYAYFMTGEVKTAEGTYVPVGQLTIGEGHADDRLGYRGAAAHYDNVCAAWADVAVGQNDRGIWFAGMVRPSATPEMLHAARASGRLSGDWRDIRGNLELCAALTVNSGGFPIPRFFAEDGRQVSLVAAGIVPPDTEAEIEEAAIAAFDMDLLVDKLMERITQRETVRELQSALSGGA